MYLCVKRESEREVLILLHERRCHWRHEREQQCHAVPESGVAGGALCWLYWTHVRDSLSLQNHDVL